MTSVTACAIALALAAAFSALARRLPGPSALPLPNRWHSSVTPVTGGIAIFGAFVLALLGPFITGAIPHRYVPLVVIAGAAFALGLLDDARRLTVLEKCTGQLAIGFAAAAYGVRPDWLPTAISIPVAVLVIVACMNGLNLLDNMDGLAAGTAALAALGLALVGGLTPPAGSPVVAAALAGACLGFLPFNYRPRLPAALFMGDSGSQLLGFTLGALALFASPSGAGGLAAAIAAPLLILAVPALDTGLVMLVRLGEGRPFWQGGRDHSSHRLVYRGFSERRAVAVLLAATAGCSATACALVILQNMLLTGLASGTTIAVLAIFGARLALVTKDGANGSGGGNTLGRLAPRARLAHSEAAPTRLPSDA
jgi:UDP-GlcNAc:undecaprenyl-phosphate/decaprenyl-phosphate GlcNAc-1-phosphate transferase